MGPYINFNYMLQIPRTRMICGRITDTLDALRCAKTTMVQRTWCRTSMICTFDTNCIVLDNTKLL